ncbi:GTPase/DUF3482 domain-containing protein [Allohahella marinimesophila]|uniref:GTPase/DUF3482 domain-containing protein n=1 Tax=Allohahella marinimesophila TaxID=1054972 RepID=A0ABP7PN78_9GAMM
MQVDSRPVSTAPRAPIKIAIVGHTNVGKTSLMRTLLRDSRFGEVSNHPGTTRHVEAATILCREQPVIELHDTPGLEDSIGLRSALEELPAGRDDTGQARLRQFVARADDFEALDQELKVVRQLLASDLLFYVIDVREPLVGKYRDELYVLSLAGRAVIPVLNFIHQFPNHSMQWRDYLGQLNFHAQVQYDTVVFRLEDEKRLFQKIQSLLGEHYDRVQQLIDERHAQALQIRRASAAAVAELIINVGSYRKTLRSVEPARAAIESNEISALQDLTRQAEQACSRQIIRLHRFAPDDVREAFLPVQDGSWKLDLFDVNTLRAFGVEAGSGAAKGAAVGAVLDGLTGFISLGAAAATGALAGAIFSTGARYGRDLQAAMTGKRTLCVDEPTLRLLWLRQLQLLTDLGSRGHAMQGQMQMTSVDASDLPKAWSQWLRQMRANAHWSDLIPENRKRSADPGREALADALAEHLFAQV